MTHMIERKIRLPKLISGFYTHVHITPLHTTAGAHTMILHKYGLFLLIKDIA